MKKTKIISIILKSQIRTLWKIIHLRLTKWRWSSVVLLCMRIMETSHQTMLVRSKECPKIQAVVNPQPTSKTISHNFSHLKNTQYLRISCLIIWVANHNGRLTLQDRLARNFQHYKRKVTHTKYHFVSWHKANNNKQNTHKKWVITTDNNNIFHKNQYNLTTTYMKNTLIYQEVTSNCRGSMRE